MASGRPVVATCRQHTEIAAVVSACGKVVPPEDSVGLAQAIVSLADNTGERRALGIAARKYAERNLARDAVLGNLLENFKQFVG